MLPSLFGESLFDRFFDDSLEKEFFGTHNPLYGKHAKNLMKTDVKDVNDHYEVAVDLPGFQKDEVNVELENGYLTISAAKGLDKDQKDDEGHYIRQERATGSCARSFYVGKELEPKDISAKFENGILTLHLPKAEAKKLEPKQTLIEIE